MERLTTKIDDLNYIPTATCTIARDGKVNDIDGCKEYCDSCDGDCFGCAIQKCFDILGLYEDLEEQGLLLKLPCKVGDTIYYNEDNVTYEFIVYSFDIRPLQGFVCNYEGIRLNLKNFGKTLFLTKAEAEQKLNEMESD